MYLIFQNCDYSSLLKSYLFEHIRKVHEHDGVKSAICEVCGKGFRDKLRLKRHMEIHRNKEDRIVCTCSICGKGFVREMILEVRKCFYSPSHHELHMYIAQLGVQDFTIHANNVYIVARLGVQVFTTHANNV